MRRPICCIAANRRLGLMFREYGMDKITQTLFLLFVLVTAACSSDSKNPGGNQGENPSGLNAHFFKATGGSQYEMMPLAGVRLYDNNAFAYIFKRDCDADKSGPLKDVSSTNSGKSVQESPRIGGIAESKNLCGYDAAFFWENSKLIVKDGDLSFGPTKWHGDVEYTEINQDEFIKLLKAQTQDKGFNYRTLPRDERDQFDAACKDLTGKICSDLF